MVEQGRKIDNFSHFAGGQFGNEGFAPDAWTFFAELGVTPNQVAEQGGFIKNLIIIASLGAAADTDAVAFPQFRKTRLLQVSNVLIPNNNVPGRQPRIEQALHD